MTVAELRPDLLEAIAERSHERPLTAVNGVLCFDVRGGERTERWYLHWKKGVITLSGEGGDPDCVVTGDVTTLTAVLSGRANFMAAILRGALEVEGRFLLLVSLRRLLSSEDVAVERLTAGYAERRS